jgi:hypothetical protein
MLTKRHKWNMIEINSILFLRRFGLKLNDIGQIFEVTANAVRKALQRHCEMYQKNTTIKPYKLYFTIEDIIKYGIINQIITCKNHNIYYNNRLITKSRAVIIINQHRSSNSLSQFRIRQ